MLSRVIDARSSLVRGGIHSLLATCVRLAKPATTLRAGAFEQAGGGRQTFRETTSVDEVFCLVHISLGGGALKRDLVVFRGLLRMGPFRFTFLQALFYFCLKRGRILAKIQRKTPIRAKGNRRAGRRQSSFSTIIDFWSRMNIDQNYPLSHSGPHPDDEVPQLDKSPVCLLGDTFRLNFFSGGYGRSGIRKCFCLLGCFAHHEIITLRKA